MSRRDNPESAHWCGCCSTMFDELLSLPKGALTFTPEEKRAMLDKGDEDILRYYGVKARAGSDLLQ
jgi:hypothetical protein